MVLSLYRFVDVDSAFDLKLQVVFLFHPYTIKERPHIIGKQNSKAAIFKGCRTFGNENILPP